MHERLQSQGRRPDGRRDVNGADLPAPTPSPWIRLKWQAFRSLDAASTLLGTLRGRPPKLTARNQPAPPFGMGTPSAWLFVSTIGELNALDPFLRELICLLAPMPITLISDRKVYREAYLERYPNAFVFEMDGVAGDEAALARLTPPCLLLVAEIPCLPSDGPCRFSFGMVYEAKRRGVPTVLVNGWLYGENSPSFLDRLERRWFARDYLRLFDLVTVQTDAVRRQLLARGASPDRVLVTGNTKFDALHSDPWVPAGKRSERLLAQIVESNRPTVVAGCVTEFEDQVVMLDALRDLRTRVNNAFLVLAPRHPEQRERMARLESLLLERQVRYAFRSRLEGGELPKDIDCLVLDTFGELKDFYAAGSIAFVGRDHNILEPLSFGRPLTIMPGWEKRYPSYPVYELLRGTEYVVEVLDKHALGDAWAEMLGRARDRDATRTKVLEMLTRHRGAVAKNLQAIASSLPLQRPAR